MTCVYFTDQNLTRENHFSSGVPHAKTQGIDSFNAN